MYVLAVLAAVVAFTAPVGFTENAKLDARASWVAGKPVRVYCASTDAVWNAFVESSGVTVNDVHGLTLVVGGDETYIDYQGCLALYGRLRGEAVYLPTFGAVLDVLAHESIHMRGESDEGITECSAIRLVPSYLVSQWGFRAGRPAYLRVLRGARDYHSRLAPNYRTVC